MLAEVGQHEVVRDGRDRVEARLAELALDVVLRREPVAAVRVEAGVRRLPRGLRGEQLRDVRLGAARLAARRRARPPGGARGRPPRRAACARAIGNCTPWLAPIGRPKTTRSEAYARRLLDEPAPVADALRRDQDRARRSSRRGCSGTPCPPRRSARPRAPRRRRGRPRSSRGSSSSGSAGSSAGRRRRRMSTRNTERPSVRCSTSSAGVVRASSSIRSECSARDVQIFWPRIDVAAVDALGRRRDLRRVRARPSAR